MIRVLVVDDHEWVRDGVVSVLDSAADVVVVGTGADGHAALELAALLRPDVITLDVMMPGMDGFRVCRFLRDRGHPQARGIMLSASVPGPTVERARAVGAVGYLVKAGDPDELVAAVRAAAVGGQWWCEQAAAVLRASYDVSVVPRPAHRPVTRFERRGLAAGRRAFDLLARLI